MNAIVTTPETNRTASRIDNGVEWVHNNPRDCDLFSAFGRVYKEPLFDRGGRQLKGFYGLRNERTGNLIESPPVSEGYKLVDHASLYGMHADRVLSDPSLPHDDLTVIDRVYDDGRRATRTIHFNGATVDIDGKGDGVTARADIINSVDMTWAFQVFSGAYRDYCRNTLVFGGEKAYHQKRKHTSNLSPTAIVEKAQVSLSHFVNQRDQMKAWQLREITLQEYVRLLEETVCKKGGRGSELSADRSTRINGRLLDYLTHRYLQEERELGPNLWAAFNALTHWSTHTDETWERINDDGTVTELATSRAGSKQYMVQHQRGEKVRGLLASPQWAALEGAAA